MPKLGVNIDHIATLRQARREFDPDPLVAARLCERAGADSIVAHLREDRRHIQDRDIYLLRQRCRTRFNLEMSLAPAIIKIALQIKPDQVTLVPEKRQEITTEGGLDVFRQFDRVKKATVLFQKKNIEVSLFIAPDEKQIHRAAKTGASTIELHTGEYANAKTKISQSHELKKLQKAAVLAQSFGLVVNAGHGLNLDNVRSVAQIVGMNELNIGHAIISRAVFVGLEKAVKEMRKIVKSVG